MENLEQIDPRLEEILTDYEESEHERFRTEWKELTEEQKAQAYEDHLKRQQEKAA